MNTWHATISAVAFGIACAVGAQTSAPSPTQQQRQQDLKGAEKVGQRDDVQPMTAAQQAQYKQEYDAAKAKWAAMTPQQKQATIAAAKGKKLSELSAIELVGQRDDMRTETAAQSAQLKADADAAKAKWDKLTPAEKQATIAAAKSKKLSELSAIELVGQRDDMRSETAAQSAQLKAEADAAKAKWDKLTPAEKQAVRKSAWQKRRADLDGMEAVGQRDDSYVLPF
jgi:predicted Fe-S protein YdhL (DUF1289 family)